MRLTNWITNPGGEAGAANWHNGGGIKGAVVVDPTFTARMTDSRGVNMIRWDSVQTDAVRAAGTVSGLMPPGLAPVTPGQVVRGGIRAYMDGDIEVAVGFRFYDADQNQISQNAPEGVYASWYEGRDLGHTMTVPARAAFARLAANIKVLRDWPADSKKRVWFENAYLYVGNTEAETPAEYIDGDMTSNGRVTYGWTGEPHASPSYRVDTLDLVHWWTRKWWEFLPVMYRSDRNVNPEIGGYPMLRFMEGVGRIAGQVRDLTDDIWAGRFMNPATVPDNALSWLAQLMGTDELGRELPGPELRQYLVDMSSDGRVAVGTRTHIQHVAKNYLTNERRVAVVPSTKKIHSLILVVAENDMPNLDVAAFMAKVRASGIVPAGHEITVSLAVSTWDGWTDAAGVSWDELEANVKTWSESDALGVVLE